MSMDDDAPRISTRVHTIAIGNPDDGEEVRGMPADLREDLPAILGARPGGWRSRDRALGNLLSELEAGRSTSEKVYRAEQVLNVRVDPWNLDES